MVQYVSTGNLFTINRESIPLWYKVEFNFELKTFEFVIQTQVANWCEENFNKKSFGHIKEYCSDFNFKFTAPEQNNKWGFDNTIYAKEIVNQQWVKYKIEVPTKTYYKNSPVFTAESNTQILSSCASISELALMLGCVPYNLPKDLGQKQILHFYTSLSAEKNALNRFPVSAYLSKEVCEWGLLASQSDINTLAYEIDKIENIICGYTNILESPRSWINLISGFYISINIGVHLGLSPNMANAKPKDYDIGYTLVSDNADNCTNQLILLCSLAILSKNVGSSLGLLFG